MKITCDFCKTEYSVPSRPAAAVKCAICGHTWTVSTPARREAFLKIFAALCALFSAIVFAAVVMMTHDKKVEKSKPLVATITGYETVVDEAGVSRLVVSGRITNQSDELYGVPDLVLVSHGADDTIIEKQKFMPSATLLDSGSYTEFRHILSVPVSTVKKITVELPNLPTSGGKK
jgi:predicted Zn finger-like uncharacterized protein